MTFMFTVIAGLDPAIYKGDVRLKAEHDLKKERPNMTFMFTVIAGLVPAIHKGDPRNALRLSEDDRRKKGVRG